MKRFACLIALAALAACSTDSTAPATTEPLDDTTIDLVQQFDATGAAAVDRAGIGGSELPENLKLTAEQKARIQALHEAFQADNAASLAALKTIEHELRAALTARKDRAAIAAILAKAMPIVARLSAALASLQRDIWNVYTAEQQAWISSKGRGESACRPDVVNQLSAAQVAQIRELRSAFGESVQGYFETIKQVHEEARAAAQAGATRAQVSAILARAESTLEALRTAERRLAEAILGVLTPEQKANACLVRALTGR